MAQHGFYLQVHHLQVRVGRLEGQGITVLGFLVFGAAALARAVAHLSYPRLSEYDVLCC
jgi:hypothetical protein